MIEYELNLNGDTVSFSVLTVAELANYIEGMVSNPTLMDDITTLKQVAMAKGAFTSSGKTAPKAEKPRSAAPPPKGVPTCPHGDGQWAEGVNKSSGKPYKGWYCPGKSPNKCQPIKIADENGHPVEQ